MMKSISLFTMLLLFTINSYSQRWKSERYFVELDAGVSHFMGDLGGGTKDAAHFFGVRDLDFSATRPVLSAKFRYRILEQVSAKAGFTWAMLSADDAASGSLGRKLRNLSFSSHVFQFSLHGEYFFIKEKVNPRYSISSLRSLRDISAYIFTGVSAFYFNPKGEFEGKKYELQPLGTEGQGIGDNPAPYSRFAFGFPIGLGAKYKLNKKISIGLEISNTFTTSDYIDDAHSKYFDNGSIVGKYGVIAGQLADRHINESGEKLTPYASGTLYRGDEKYNDAFIFTVVTVSYTLKKDTRGLPKF